MRQYAPKTPTPMSNNQIVPSTCLATRPAVAHIPGGTIAGIIDFSSGTLTAASSLLAHAPKEVHNLLRATRTSLVAAALLVVRIHETSVLL